MPPQAVLAAGLPVLARQQLHNDLVAEPLYTRLTAVPADPAPVPIGVERPILHAQIDLDQVGGGGLHVVNVHLKSKIPTDIPGQKEDTYTWRTADGWAEGVLISSMKRMSQAHEVRRLVDQILDADPMPASSSPATSTPPPTKCPCSPSAATSKTPATATSPGGSSSQSSKPSPNPPATRCSTKAAATCSTTC
jgi:hypothetical protein